MKSKILFLSLILSLGFTVNVNAQSLGQDSISSVVSAYRFYKDIDNIAVFAPTVAEVPFATEFIERLNFAVFDKTTNAFEPHFFNQEILINEIPVSINTTPNVANASRMIDKDVKTYTDFILPENTQGQVQITLFGSDPITSSALTVLLDNNVALPTSVEIRAVVDGQNRIVVADRKMDQETVRFPQTTSNMWQITFSYSQPLRINELRLNQDGVTKLNNHAVRFLAQPDHSYRIYFDPDRRVKAPVSEMGNLATAQDVLIISDSLYQNNTNYIIADVDNDGVPDVHDNCVSFGNADQKDINNNGRGDMCEDFDRDGLVNSKDNCPNNPNQNQRDTDSDGIGDICDKEESRITERNSWIPWAGIGFAAVVLVSLLFLTARTTDFTKRKK